MGANFKLCEACPEKQVIAVGAAKQIRNKVEAVTCKSKTVEVFKSVTIEITKFKMDYDPASDGSVQWDIETDSGRMTTRRNTSGFDFHAVASLCYKTVRIYPYLVQRDPEVFVELKIENTINIIPRSRWGARPPVTDDPKLSYEKVDDLQTYDSIVIHHSGNESSFPTMKMVQDKHMDARGSGKRADIGYHFGIDKEGKIYEGRDINRKGSHVNKGNTGKIGIVLLADLSTDGEGLNSVERWLDTENGYLANLMVQSLLKLCVHLDHLYGISEVGGHKEFAVLQGEARACPGNLTMDRMDTWRKILNKKKP